MKRAFKTYDKDGNGVLSPNEIWFFLESHFKEQGISQKPTKKDIDDFFDQLDEDHSGEIGFDEFKNFLIQTLCKKMMAPLKEYLQLKGIKLE